MEEGFEDAITDKSYYHPMQTNEYHSAIGIVNDDVGMHPIQHFTEIDEGKQSEKNCREIRKHVKGEVSSYSCMVVK
jgi:hypothetical protein